MGDARDELISEQGCQEQPPIRPEQLRLAEKLDFWETFSREDVERMLLRAADEIERLRTAVDLEMDTYGDNQLNRWRE